MKYKWVYITPTGLDNIIMSSDGEYLTGLWFKDSESACKQKVSYKQKFLPIFKETSNWLDIYFSGQEPNFMPKYKIEALTPFRKEVIDIMGAIPFGKTVTYGDISNIIAENRSIKKCHRRQWEGQLDGTQLVLLFLVIE